MMMNKSYMMNYHLFMISSHSLFKEYIGLWLLCEWAARKECEDSMDGLSLLLQRELFAWDWHQVMPVDGYHRIQNPSQSYPLTVPVPDSQMASFPVGRLKHLLLLFPASDSDNARRKVQQFTLQNSTVIGQDWQSGKCIVRHCASSNMSHVKF